MYFPPVAARRHVLRTDSHDQTNKDRGSVSISGQLFAYCTLELLALAIVVPSLRRRFGAAVHGFQHLFCERLEFSNVPIPPLECKSDVICVGGGDENSLFGCLN